MRTKSIDRIVAFLKLATKATPQEITQHLSLNESTVYCQLRRLQSRGIVTNHVTPRPWPHRHHSLYFLTQHGLDKAKEIA